MIILSCVLIGFRLKLIVNGLVVSYKSENETPLQDLVIYGLPNEDFTEWTGGPIVGRGNFMPTYVTGLDAETGQGKRAVVHYTTGAQAVEVEVGEGEQRLHALHDGGGLVVGRNDDREVERRHRRGRWGGCGLRFGHEWSHSA